MGRRRKPENDHLPGGVYPSRGWYFWKDPATGDWHKLGKEWNRAARDKWVNLSTGKAKGGTVAHLIDAHLIYRLQLVREAKLAARTYEDNIEHAHYLKLAFGAMPYYSVNSRHCTDYLRKRTWQPKPKKAPDGTLVPQPPRSAPVRANREMSFLSATYSWALESNDFPLVTANPCIGITYNTEKRRERCPEIWEIEAAKTKAPGQWSLIFDLAYICGTRGVDARMMQKSQLRPEGIYFPAVKGGNEVIIEWNDDLYATVLGLLAWSDDITERLHVACPYVIVARGGGPYTAHGWKTTVYKIIRAAIADSATGLKEPFSFHDFRARSATDEEEIYGTSPQNRLRHRRRATTDIYMRGKKIKRVKPLPLRKAS